MTCLPATQQDIRTVSLRPYQETAKAALRDAMMRYRSVCYEAPTGSGKTILFSSIAYSAAMLGTKTCLLTHRRELLLQASRALHLWGVDHGIIAPGYPRTDHLIQVASKDTLRRRDGYRWDLVIPDEAHHCVAETYRGILDGQPCLGFTATPCRMSGRGLGTVFQHLVSGPAISDLITQGYLPRPVVYGPPVPMNLKGIRSQAGDYDRQALTEMLDRQVVTGNAIEHYVKYFNGRPALVFCVSVAHAEHTAEQYRAAGIRAESVDGSMSTEARDDRIRSIADGRLDALMSCDLISEGLDVPGVYGVQFLRPTKSIAIYRQQSGRAMRAAPGKTEALILDHVGNYLRHGMPDRTIEWTLEDGAKKTAPTEKARQCPECYYVHDPTPKCPNCGHFYYVVPRIKEQKHQAGELVLVSPEEGQKLFVAAQATGRLSDFHKWAKQTGKKSGAAWHAWQRQNKKGKRRYADKRTQ